MSPEPIYLRFENTSPPHRKFYEVEKADRNRTFQESIPLLKVDHATPDHCHQYPYAS